MTFLARVSSFACFFIGKKIDLFHYFLRRRPYLKIYGTGCSSMTFCKSIVSQARANGLVSTKALSEGDKRVDSLKLLKLTTLSAFDGSANAAAATA